MDTDRSYGPFDPLHFDQISAAISIDISHRAIDFWVQYKYNYFESFYAADPTVMIDLYETVFFSEQESVIANLCIHLAFRHTNHSKECRQANACKRQHMCIIATSKYSILSSGSISF